MKIVVFVAFTKIKNETPFLVEFKFFKDVVKNQSFTPFNPNMPHHLITYILKNKHNHAQSILIPI